jgi:hypothetical protein
MTKQKLSHYLKTESVLSKTTLKFLSFLNLDFRILNPEFLSDSVKKKYLN